MTRVTGVVIPLLAVLCVDVQAVAQPAPPPPPPAAAPDGAAPAASPADAAPAPAPQRKVWIQWLDREQPRPEWDPELAPTWYGWQTLLVDALSIATAALTFTAAVEGFWLGVGMLMIGSPIVHFAHLNVTQGLGSIGIRLLPGSLFVLAGTASGDKDPVGFGWLGVLATTVVMIVDAAVLAWKEHPVEEQPRAWLTPWLDPQQGRVGLSYATRF